MIGYNKVMISYCSRVFILMFLTASCIMAERRETISEESKVPPYTLPDPLECQDGTRVTDAAVWVNKRRPELLKLFENEIYGRTLIGRPENLKFIVRDEKKDARNSKAIRLRIGILFEGKEDGRGMEMLLYLPNRVKGPVPVFLGLNFDGNYTIVDDPDIPLPDHWANGLFKNKPDNHKPTEAGRGIHAYMWQCDYVLDHGYGLATIAYGDIEPDEGGRIDEGPRGLGPKIGTGDWGMIGSWAWGLSRAVDYLETNERVDSKRIILTGFSRIGKAALWAGAQDERFAMVVSNNSGGGGAALAKRIFGETVANLAGGVWFCENFKKYADREQDLLIDHHELIALIAPRPVLIMSATEDLWSDPKGEFLSGVGADPVYRLFGTDGIAQKDWPEPGRLIDNTIGYYLRAGKHDVTFEDWQAMVVFADKWLAR